VATNKHNGAQLSWNANTESDLASYKIYFSQFPGILNNLTAQTLNTGNTSTGITFPYTFFDKDGTWRFAVTAIDTSGNESGQSNVVSKRIIATESQFVRRK
jgi:hypothetical protein